jgi:hypothetical protein
MNKVMDSLGRCEVCDVNNITTMTKLDEQPTPACEACAATGKDNDGLFTESFVNEHMEDHYLKQCRIGKVSLWIIDWSRQVDNLKP